MRRRILRSHLLQAAALLLIAVCLLAFAEHRMAQQEQALMQQVDTMLFETGQYAEAFALLEQHRMDSPAWWERWADCCLYDFLAGGGLYGVWGTDLTEEWPHGFIFWGLPPETVQEVYASLYAQNPTDQRVLIKLLLCRIRYPYNYHFPSFLKENSALLTSLDPIDPLAGAVRAWCDQTSEGLLRQEVLLARCTQSDDPETRMLAYAYLSIFWGYLKGRETLPPELAGQVSEMSHRMPRLWALAFPENAALKSKFPAP